MTFLLDTLVLKLSKTKIDVFNVSLTKKVRELASVNWSEPTLEAAVAEITSVVKPRRIRLLLAEDVSFVVTGELPADMQKNKQRLAVKQLVLQQIPEELEEESWDYKVVTKKSAPNTYIAFAPLLSVYKPVVAALQESGFSFETVEPESVAAERHTNSVVGIAIKKDIKGRDSDQLSIVPDDEQDFASVFLNKATLVSLLGIILGILVTATLVVYFVRSGDRAIENKASMEQVSLEEAVVDIEASALPAADESEQDQVSEAADLKPLETYSVVVLNGSGQAGVASEIAEELESAGFENVETGNAESYDFEDISVAFKEDLNESDLLLGLIQEAFSEYDVTEQEKNNQDYQFDIEIIIGS